MKKGKFEGTSTNGSIEDAITNAIDAAKHELKSEMISWKLDTVSGENGGITPINIVIVSVKAKAIKAKKVEVKEVKIKQEKAKKVETKIVKAEVIKDKVVKTKAKAKK